jgi:hypothetical protein
MKNKIILFIVFVLSICTVCVGCLDFKESSDQKQTKQQERLLAEGTAQVGMPNIKNFRERKLLKDILEMRDQEGLSTWTYLWSEIQGKWVFFCHSVGYGIPYSTQFTNPSKIEFTNRDGQAGYSYDVLPQADPNGLFSPSSADGTWVLCKDPNDDKVLPVLVEPRCIVSPFDLTPKEVPKEPKDKAGPQ